MIRTEPAVLISFAAAVIALLVAVGLLNSGIEDAVNLVVAEFVALMVASGFIIRSQVTPVN